MFVNKDMTETIVYTDPKSLELQVSLTRFHDLLCQKHFVDQLRPFQLANLHQNLLESYQLRKIDTD